MSIPAQHPTARVKAYIRLLRNCSAPQVIIDDFKELIDIDNGISSEGRGYVDPLEDHFFHTCLRHNFPRPFDKDGNVAFFRPGINQSGFHGISDTGWGSALDGNLDAEQAYRRGYAHGFDEAKCLVRENNLKQIERRGHEINRWRFARVWYGRTQPGTFDDWMPEIKSYRSISPKRRFDVLERDGRRCVVCGDDAKSGAVLEVDHIVSVANGGSDDLENLQTLCWACNSGKGAR